MSSFSRVSDSPNLALNICNWSSRKLLFLLFFKSFWPTHACTTLAVLICCLHCQIPVNQANRFWIGHQELLPRELLLHEAHQEAS